MYAYKELYTIDFSEVKYYLEMHKVIKEALDFPDYYGENYDALWDCLTDMEGRETNIEIVGIDVIEEKFGQEEADKLLSIFSEFKHDLNDAHSDEITITVIRGNERELLE